MPVERGAGRRSLAPNALDEPFGPQVKGRLDAAWAPQRRSRHPDYLVPLQLATLERQTRAAPQVNQPHDLRFDYFSRQGLA